MDKDFLASISLPPYTQDQFVLDQAPCHLVFDCGPIHYGLAALNTAFTRDKLSLFKTSNGLALPIRMDNMHRARIAGTMYLMEPEQIMKLDKQKGNGVYFDRTAVSLILPIQDEVGDLHRVYPAWMYIANKEHWSTKILWDQIYHKRSQDRDFSLADTYLDNRPLLNNHFSYGSVRLEDKELPEIPTVDYSGIIEYCARSNKEEIRRLKKGLFSMNWFKRG